MVETRIRNTGCPDTMRSMHKLHSMFRLSPSHRCISSAEKGRDKNVKLDCSNEVARRFVFHGVRRHRASYVLRLIKEECDEKAQTYLAKLDPKRFARFAVPVARYGHESGHTVYSVNGQLCEQRAKPILKAVGGHMGQADAAKIEVF